MNSNDKSANFIQKSSTFDFDATYIIQWIGSEINSFSKILIILSSNDLLDPGMSDVIELLSGHKCLVIKRLLALLNNEDRIKISLI